MRAPVWAQGAREPEQTSLQEPAPEAEPDDPMFQIQIQPMSGPCLTLDVSPCTTVAGVQGMIAQCQGVPPDRQTLLQDYRLLEGSRTLQSYGVEAGTVLYLNTHLRGSMGDPAGGPDQPDARSAIQVFVKGVPGRSAALKVSPPPRGWPR